MRGENASERGPLFWTASISPKRATDSSRPLVEDPPLGRSHYGESAFALVFAGTVNPSTIRLSGKSEWRGDAIFLRSNVRMMLRMKFLAAQSERLPLPDV